MFSLSPLSEWPLIVAFISFYKLPYVIYKPGGSIDLTSRVNIEDGDEDIDED